MSEMIERVAKAIHYGFDKYPPVAKELALLDARKAIEAMKEPTKAMIKAANDQYGGTYSYKTMITAALEETKG